MGKSAERRRSGVAEKPLDFVNAAEGGALVARPPFMPIVWGEADQLLGTLSDRELARHLHVDPHTVQARRQLLGIAPYRTPRRGLVIVCAICGQRTPVVG